MRKDEKAAKERFETINPSAVWDDLTPTAKQRLIGQERERQRAIPKMALRYQGEELDDVVVKDVTMFRAEIMSENELWLCCYLPNGERITFWVNGKKLSYSATEVPEYIDMDKEKNG